MIANELITAAKRLIIGAVSASMLISTTALSGCGEKKQSGSRLDNIVTVNAVPELEPLGLDSTETLTESLNLGLSVPETLKKAYKNVGDTNPISPNLFFADPTSVEYNGRIYLYGTCDQEEYQKNGEKGDNTYGGIDKISCFSTADMKNWTYHGDINVSIVTNWAGLSWAPSIISRPTEDGTTEFFLYFTTGGGGIGVLKATSPLGPWTDPIGGPLLAGDTAELKDDPICWVFDPGACIDDDGVGWLAFGGGDPQQEGETGLNTRNCRIVRLGEDMVSLDSKIEVIEAPYHFEANELNYIDGKFYLTYCSNWQPRNEWPEDKYGDYPMPLQCTMCYMVSDDPLNPDSWEYKGEYLLNPTSFGYPFSNNHTHLQEFNGKFYLFYQTVSLLSNMGKTDASGYRSVGVNELEVNTNKAEFSEGSMDNQGVEQVQNFDPFVTTEAETANVTAGVQFKRTSGEMAAIAEDGGWIALTSVDFDKGADLFGVNAMGKGIIEIRLDDKDGAAVGSIQFESLEDYSVTYCRLAEKISGVHDLYLVFGGEVTLDKWQFAAGE